MKFLSILFAIIIGFVLMGSILIARHPIPDSYLPWKTIKVNDEINFLTSTKISRLEKDFNECKSFFENSDIEYKEIPDKTVGKCELTHQIQINKSLYPYSSALKGQCGLMAATAIWEKQIIEPLAEKYLSSPISEITHYGIFSCRNIKGSKRRSQHSSANAIDIAGFKMSNGKKISVLKDWNKDTNEGKFLRELFSKSCSIFNGNLGPNYNRSHKDHLNHN